MKEVHVHVLLGEFERARTKPLLAVLATKLGVTGSRSEARSWPVADLRTLIKERLDSVVAGQPMIVMEADGSAYMATNNPQAPDPKFEAKVDDYLKRHAAGETTGDDAFVGLAGLLKEALGS